MAKTKRFKRGQIVQHLTEGWMGIYLKPNKKFSHVLRLTENGDAEALATVFTKELDNPFDIPKNFNQIDITI